MMKERSMDGVHRLGFVPRSSGLGDGKDSDLFRVLTTLENPENSGIFFNSGKHREI